ncbi:hypothetical protein [uncultured Arcticibacterium sp.]|uniref:hypothetical protein n=1 Tax=uncultured Arcticibacterium sp. TaxID=2173042 RepID=UPI0030F6FE67
MRYLVVFLFFSSTIYGQSTVMINLTLPSVAKMDVEPNKNGFNLALTAPSEAGNGITNQTTNSSKWINFTSAVTPGYTRAISANYSGTALSGLDIIMEIASHSGGGAGARGNSVSSIILSNSSQTIISGIGGAYTGNGINNGYNLTYSLDVTDFSLLRNASKSLTVVFTMSDN